MWRKILAVALSVALLTPGWIGGSGLTLIVALVPMLWLSSKVEESKRGWWEMFAWVTLMSLGWNLATILWIGNATIVGPIAATTFATIYTLISFMCFHTASKKASKALSYTILVSLWITLEHYYTYSEISWPWLLLGNGLSNDIWAVQWYEYTGLFGGSAWLLLCNILIFEGWQSRNRAVIAGAASMVILPLLISYGIFKTYEEPKDKSVIVSAIQPNVDCYDKFNGDRGKQKENLIDLICELPSNTEFIFMPETSIPEYYWESSLERAPYIQRLRDTLSSRLPNAIIISGANTMVRYNEGEQSETARKNRGEYYDIFNSAIGITPESGYQLHHKVKLVIGVENTPSWIFKVFKFFVVDLGGIVGQIGRGTDATTFTHNDITTAPAICYEGLYGEFFAEFVRGGAEFMGIVSNDGWWGDTAGHRHLYSMSSLRAIENRRYIARSANTGVSGFIDSRGVSLESMGWDKRGVMTHEVWLNDRLTIYTKYGDYIARIAQFLAILSLLYYVAYRIKRRNYLD